MRKWINLLKENYDHKEVVNRVHNELDWSSGAGEGVIEDYMRANDINDEEEINTDSEEFMEWFDDWVEDNYSDVEYKILHCVKNGHITLWRCITAPQDWTPEGGRHPGIYWSYNEHAAEAHWGSFGGDVAWVMQTTVPVGAIDWLPTLVQASQPDYQDEDEVRIKDGYPVVIEKYWRKK